MACRHEFAARSALRSDMLAQCGDLVAQLGDLVLEREHVADSLEVHPRLDELRDAMQPRDVGLTVSTIAALRASGSQQAFAFVVAQRLGMHAGELGGDGDHVHRDGVVVAFWLLAHDASSLAYASSASRCCSVSDVGTTTSTVTMRSPDARSKLMPRPFTR